LSEQKHVYLIGYMAAGKTWLGRELAQQLVRPFYDLDAVLEEKESNTIAGLFNSMGESGFREKEREILLETAHWEPAVIACGGGTPCYKDNLLHLKKQGLTLWVNTPYEIILERLKKERSKRPLLAGITDEELNEKLNTHYQSRLTCYNQAHLAINPQEITIETLIQIIIRSHEN
jgi:shikimate kinase